MAELNKDIVVEVLSLPMNERVSIVEKLLESLDAPSNEINDIWAMQAR